MILKRGSKPLGSIRNFVDDVTLLRLCYDGNQEAWETLVIRYSPLIFSIARACGLSTPEAERVHEWVFEHLARELGSGVSGPFIDWLIKETCAKVDEFALDNTLQMRQSYDVVAVTRSELLKIALRCLPESEERLLVNVLSDSPPRRQGQARQSRLESGAEKISQALARLKQIIAVMDLPLQGNL